MMMHNERGGRVETRGSLIDEGNGNKRRLGHTGDQKNGKQEGERSKN